jgi:hypothetical protein
MELLRHLGVDRSRAYEINAAGQVVGYTVDPDTYLAQAVF